MLANAGAIGTSRESEFVDCELTYDIKKTEYQVYSGMIQGETHTTMCVCVTKIKCRVCKVAERVKFFPPVEEVFDLRF